MPLLTQHTDQMLWGGCEIVEADPDLTLHENVYCLPFQQGGRWGVFGADDRIVEPTVDRWMPHGATMDQILDSPYRAADIPDALPDDAVHLYAGRLTFHFGHFITESLSRLWPLAEGGRPAGMKILFHGPGWVDQWWSLPYVRNILGALGIGRSDIIHLKAPVRVRRLWVPHAAFSQQAKGHHAYRRLCAAVGSTLLGGALPPFNARPVYLSKTAVPEGVRKLVNEDVVERAMDVAGVEIVRPEHLTLSQQIALIASRRALSGPVSSAHHVSIFTPAGARFEMLSPDPELNSNFFIIDALAGNRSRHFHAETTRLSPENPTFLTYQALVDPEGVARELLERLA